MALRVASLKGLKIKIPRSVKVASAAIYLWRSQRLAGNLRLGPEDKIHLAIMAYLRMHLHRDAVAFHIPSEADRSGAWWAKLLGMGYLNGLPDITILSRGRAYFIEVKSPEGRLTVDQEGFRDWARSCGFPWTEARGIDIVSAFLTEHDLRA